MKKVFALILALAMLLGCISAAGAEDTILGKWTMDQESIAEAMRIAGGEEAAALAPLVTYIWEFNDDGTLVTTMSAMGQEQVLDDVWEYMEDGLYLTISGSPSYVTYRFEDDKLLLTGDDMVISLTRAEDEASADDIAAAGDPAFITGRWDGSEFYSFLMYMASLTGEDTGNVESLLSMMTVCIDFNADGTAMLVISFMGYEDSEALGNWSMSGDTLTLAGLPFTVSISGDIMTLDPLIGDTFTMTRIN